MLARIPETYLLNASQVSHLIVLAGFVPWYIGLESYGVFAALIALPGFIQSSFEAYAIAILSGGGSRDTLRKAIKFVLIPLTVAILVSYIHFAGFFAGSVATVMALLLFYRSYAFAVAISTGTMTSRLMRSDFLIVLVYLVVLSACTVFGVRDHLLPAAMVCGASLLSGWYLLHAPGVATRSFLSKETKTETRLPKDLVFRAASARLYEDGFLSLSPLVLAAATSTIAAGQFRVFVSVVKALYKLFPVRYEVAIRDLFRGDLRASPLVRASWIFCAASLVVAAAGFAVVDAGAYGWIVVLAASGGAAVSSLALYPAVCSVDRAMTLLCVSLMVVTAALAYCFGTLGFSLGFASASYIVMLRSFAVLKVNS
jgi:hypothetical protein